LLGHLPSRAYTGRDDDTLARAMERINVELKARDAEPDTTAARCVAFDAEDEGMLTQLDTYFAVQRGRLKLREEDDGAELIAYRRRDARGPEPSAYVRATVADPAPVKEALDAALGTIVAVSKRRQVFIWEHVRIHLDDVDGLGTFIEIEAVVGPGEDQLAEAYRKVDWLRSELLISDDDLVDVGYADLLLDGPQSLLLAADAAMRNAYAPYSEFKVGAALRAASGAIYSGANVENVAYPQGACAEASAIGALVSAGESKITAVAVVAEKVERCPPCGGCRQRLVEFGAPGTPVYLGRPGAEPYETTLAELLPGAFGREELGG
jgi:homotetrameric cytidine deaminase